MTTLAQATEALDLYVRDRVRPGEFLEAVLCNDLLSAVSHADPDADLLLLRDLSRYLRNIPIECFGTPAKVARWLARKENT